MRLIEVSVPKIKVRRQIDYYVSRKFQQDHLTPPNNTGEILEQDRLIPSNNTGEISGQDEDQDKMTTEISVTEDSTDATDSANDSDDSTNSSVVDSVTEPLTITSETEFNVAMNLQKHKPIGRVRTGLRHSIMEDFPTLYNNKDTSEYDTKNWYYEGGLNGVNSNYRDIMADWSYKHSPKHESHSNHESHFNSEAHSNHQHHFEKGDSWMPNDSPNDGDTYDDWPSSHFKTVQNHHKDFGLEDELVRSPKQLHFGDKLQGNGGKLHYSKNWVGSYAGSKNWGGLDLDSKQSGQSRASAYYGKWNRAHLKPTNWEGLHSVGTAGDAAYFSGPETHGGAHYYKNEIFGKGAVSPAHYNSEKSRSYF